MKKRYWLFYCAHYSASGGMADFEADFDTLEELKNSKTYLDLKKDEDKGYITIDIYDLHEDKTVK